jgi:hypothetical protein
MVRQLTTVYKKHGKWYLGWVEEIQDLTLKREFLKR